MHTAHVLVPTMSIYYLWCDEYMSTKLDVDLHDYLVNTSEVTRACLMYNNIRYVTFGTVKSITISQYWFMCLRMVSSACGRKHLNLGSAVLPKY